MKNKNKGSMGKSDESSESEEEEEEKIPTREIRDYENEN